MAVGFTVTLPEGAKSPFTPETETAVAFWVDHVNTVEPPAGMVDGLAVNEVITGAEAGCFADTVTVADAVAVPPGPVAVNVYDVLSVGFTVTDPETGKLPWILEILTDVAFVVAQLRVTLSPMTMLVGFAVKLVITGTEVVVPPPFPAVFAPPPEPQEIDPRMAVTTAIDASRRRVACMG